LVYEPGKGRVTLFVKDEGQKSSINLLERPPTIIYPHTSHIHPHHNHTLGGVNEPLGC
jgi:hypothetical protein